MIREAETPPPSTRLARAGGSPSAKDTTLSGAAISARRLRGELDWITLKALAKDRNRRYQSARELAEDLTRFSAGQPVVAGPPGIAYRTKKFARRHPAGIAVALACLAIVGFSSISRTIRQKREARLAGEHLLAADSTAGPFVLAEAAPHLDRLRTTLERAADDPSAPLQARIHASLALAGGDAGEVRRLCRLLLGGNGEKSPDPDQAAALQAGILRTPEAVPASVAGEAARIAGDPTLPVPRRLGAATLLAGAVPEDQVWKDLAPKVARLACSVGAVDAARWARPLEPVASQLVGPLRAIFETEAEASAGLEAALVLAEFQRGQATTLADLALSAKPVQFQAVARAFLECDEALGSAEQAFRVTREFPSDGPEEARDAAAERHARAGLLVLLAGGGEQLWPWLRRPSWGDPRLRTHLIHAFAACGIPPSLPAGRLAMSEDPGERAALILILGGYGRGSIESALAASTRETVAALYREDSSAEVHSAAEWLLRSWDLPLPTLPPSPGTVPGAPPPAEPGWEVDSPTGMTFIRFRGPISFPMGSPDSEPGRSRDEYQHQAGIPHSFAIAAKVLTIAQINAFLPEALKSQPDLPPAEFPGRFLSLYQSRQICNEISRAAGLPVEEWGYTEGDSPEPKEAITRLRGYRLPTEAEWEYACRSGSSAPRHYGFAPSLLPEYACFAGTLGSGMQPPGRRRPNNFGLFDMLGNLRNFVEGTYGPYPGDTTTNALPPNMLIGLNNSPLDLPAGTVLRGQSETDPLGSFRSAKRERLIFSASTPVFLAGVRLARTLPPTTP